MGREQRLELGQRRPFVMRYGPDTPVLGMRRRGADAGAIQLPHWLYLRNIRFDDGLGGRKPHEVFQDGLAGDSVISLFDFQCTGAGRNKLYVIFAGCPGIPGAASGHSLNWYSHEPAEPFARGVYWASSTFESSMAVHDGSLFLGIDTDLNRFIIVENDYEDADNVFLAGLDQAEYLKTFTGYTIRCLCSAFGELFIGLEHIATPATLSKVVRYDGITFRDDLTGISPPSALRLFRHDTLAMTFAAAAGGLNLRDAAGTWTNVAGALGSVQCSMEEYRDNLYISENSPDLWKYDGAALAIDHSLAYVPNSGITGLAAAFGYLFFGHQRGTATNEATIGRLDSSGTYVNEHKNIAIQAGPPDFSWARNVKRLRFYRGALVAGVESILNGGRLFLSRADDTAGTWDIVTPVDPLAASFGAIVAFEVF